MNYQKADGMSYAPQGKPQPVIKPGEFVFAAAHPDHRQSRSHLKLQITQISQMTEVENLGG